MTAIFYAMVANRRTAVLIDAAGVLRKSCCGGFLRYFMCYLNWILRAALFIVLLGFAVKNDQPVTLRYFFDFEWQSSLVIVLLVFFSAGAAVGVIAMLPNVLLQRREIARLKRDIRVKNKLADIGDTQQLPIQPS
jgi:uncharacterized integral membrane protein